MTRIITISVLVFFTLMIAFILVKRYKNENSKKMWSLMGLSVGFWNGVVILSIGLTMITLLAFKVLF
jgi:hypothetical protein